MHQDCGSGAPYFWAALWRFLLILLLWLGCPASSIWSRWCLQGCMSSRGSFVLWAWESYDLPLQCGQYGHHFRRSLVSFILSQFFLLHAMTIVRFADHLWQYLKMRYRPRNRHRLHGSHGLVHFGWSTASCWATTHGHWEWWSFKRDRHTLRCFCHQWYRWHRLDASVFEARFRCGATAFRPGDVLCKLLNRFSRCGALRLVSPLCRWSVPCCHFLWLCCNLLSFKHVLGLELAWKTQRPSQRCQPKRDSIGWSDCQRSSTSYSSAAWSEGDTTAPNDRVRLCSFLLCDASLPKQFISRSDQRTAPEPGGWWQCVYSDFDHITPSLNLVSSSLRHLLKKGRFWRDLFPGAVPWAHLEYHNAHSKPSFASPWLCSFLQFSCTFLCFILYLRWAQLRQSNLWPNQCTAPVPRRNALALYLPLLRDLKAMDWRSYSHEHLHANFVPENELLIRSVFQCVFECLFKTVVLTF